MMKKSLALLAVIIIASFSIWVYGAGGITGLWLMYSGIFVLSAACYLLFITSDPLEKVGGRLGKLLHLPEDVIASTFQALATSGPEIVIAIIAATPFVASDIWQGLQLGEKACSGALNMSFSAMDNLLGIGCLGMIYMLYKKTVSPDEALEVSPSVKIGLVFYIVSSTCLCIFIGDSILTEFESWVLMGIGITFILSQFFIPALIAMMGKANSLPENPEEEDEDEEEAMPTTVGRWVSDFSKNFFVYAFLVFALIIFVQECLNSTFHMATVGVVSVGGILILFTSYVSSFPEFMMTYRYAASNNKNALLGMLFGSNVIDLAFAGFRSIWLHERMLVCTTGRFPQLLPAYLWALPVIAVLSLIFLSTKMFKYKYAYPLVVLYIIYIFSGFFLL